MKKLKIICTAIWLVTCVSFAQEGIGIGTNSPQASSALDITSTNKALLLPRVANTAAITAPVDGMMIYDLSSQCVKGYQNGAWTACGFLSTSSNGTAEVASYTCNTASAGTMNTGIAVTGVTQTITANVTAIGSYSIVAIANEIIFYASGVFANTGSQDVVLTATGAPAEGGMHTFTLNTTPNCSFDRETLQNRVYCSGGPTAVVDVVGSAGKTWMDRNLGATQVATSATDANSYGDLYQWGRFPDGHQCRNSAETITTATSAIAGHDKFILASSNPSTDYNWTDFAGENDLWQGLSGFNNPCPSGYRLPTSVELYAEGNAWSGGTITTAIAFSSVLKFPSAGYRNSSITGVGTTAEIITSTINATNVNDLFITSTGHFKSTTYRFTGSSVRCVKGS